MSSFHGITMNIISFIFVIGCVYAESTNHNISDCISKGAECDTTRERPICGTDDKTYPSRCHLLRIQCTGHQVSIKHRGPCKECQKARQFALRHKDKYQSLNKFIPKCRFDGTYAAVQCIEGYGCWCSDTSGNPIQKNSTKNRKPNCKKYGRGNNRRSPQRQYNLAVSQKECESAKYNYFITNLFQHFHNEFLEEQNVQSIYKSSINNDHILDWKFTQLDLNKNNLLDKIEFRKFKRFIKKTIKPKICARNIGRMCDSNNDEKLSSVEWKNCMSPENIENMQNNNGKNHKLDKNNFHDYAEPDEYDTDESEYDDTGNNNSLTATELFSKIRPKFYEPSSGDSGQGELDLDISNCTIERKTSADDQKRGNDRIYVPACTPHGKYEKIQCFPHTGYCWCADEDSGKIINGSLVKDKMPECKNIPLAAKNCQELKSPEFLKNLKDFLKNHISFMTNLSNITTFKSEDEKVSTISFVHLDINKNQIFERKEWKKFRELITESKLLRKCGKKLPRMCDVNNDKKITLSEWLDCLNSSSNDTFNEISTLTNGTITTSNKQTKFVGPNPLESILK